MYIVHYGSFVLLMYFDQSLLPIVVLALFQLFICSVITCDLLSVCYHVFELCLAIYVLYQLYCIMYIIVCMYNFPICLYVVLDCDLVCPVPSCLSVALSHCLYGITLILFHVY